MFIRRLRKRFKFRTSSMQLSCFGVVDSNSLRMFYVQSKADAFEYADQVLERWYPSVEDGNNKGIVVLVTSQKEGAVTGGPDFVKAVGDTILDATVSENLPGNNTLFN